MSTSMLVQAGLLPELWSKAMTTVAYIRNRLMFNSSLPQRWRRFPTEKMKDQYSQLKPFSCLCYVIVPEEKQKSFTSKTRHVRFLVLYGTLQRFLRCWILLHLYSSLMNIDFLDYQTRRLKPNPICFSLSLDLIEYESQCRQEDAIPPNNSEGSLQGNRSGLEMSTRP